MTARHPRGEVEVRKWPVVREEARVSKIRRGEERRAHAAVRREERTEHDPEDTERTREEAESERVDWREKKTRPRGRPKQEGGDPCSSLTPAGRVGEHYVNRMTWARKNGPPRGSPRRIGSIRVAGLRPLAPRRPPVTRLKCREEVAPIREAHLGCHVRRRYATAEQDLGPGPVPGSPRRGVEGRRAGKPPQEREAPEPGGPRQLVERGGVRQPGGEQVPRPRERRACRRGPRHLDPRHGMAGDDARARARPADPCGERRAPPRGSQASRHA